MNHIKTILPRKPRNEPINNHKFLHVTSQGQVPENSGKAPIVVLIAENPKTLQRFAQSKYLLLEGDHQLRVLGNVVDNKVSLPTKIYGKWK